MTHGDTRTEAKRWLDTNLPPGARVAVDVPPSGPPLSRARYRLLVANGRPLFDRSLADYERGGIEYFVESSFTSEQWVRDTRENARRRRFYALLPGRADRIATFKPNGQGRAPSFHYDQIYGPFDHLGQLNRPGPTIRVFRLRRGGS